MATRETSPDSDEVSQYLWVSTLARFVIFIISSIVNLFFLQSFTLVYPSASELHRSTSRLCIVLSITTTSLILSPIIPSILQRVSYIEVQVDCVLRYMNNRHISYSFSNHSLYNLGSELHRSTSRLCIAL